MARNINEGIIATLGEGKLGPGFGIFRIGLGECLGSRSLFPTPGSTSPSGTTRIKEIGRIGDETNVNRFFYKDVPLRCLEEVDAELKKTEREIAERLGEVTE